MYKEYRITAAGDTASTPEMWAANFAASETIGWYHRLIFRLDHRWRLIQRHVPRTGRLLDAGCGAGEWVAFLNEHGYDAEGLDYSAALIARTRLAYPRYRWSSGTVQALPYADRSIASIISWGVIEHDEAGPDRALAEFHRVLADKGVVIVTVPVDTERHRRASRVQFPESAEPGPSDGSRAFFQYYMTPEELVGFVRRAGFEVIDSGLLRATAAPLLLPSWTARLGVDSRHLVNRIVRLTCWWHRGLRNMIYCVGRRTIQS